MKVRPAVRLLLTDVDGTLLTDDRVLTDAAIGVVQALREGGIAFALTSSRPPRGLRMLVAPLTVELPLAALNGGLYVMPDFTLIRCCGLDPATVVAALAGAPALAGSAE